MTAGKRPPRPWEHTFLDAIRAGENLAGGARIAGIHRTTVSGLRQRDPRFAAELQSALSTPRKASSGAPPPPCKIGTRLELFLARLAETSNVSAAADAAGLSTATVYARRRSDPQFNERWFEALAEGYDRLEMDLLERLRTGRLEDVDAEGNKRKFDVSTAFRCISAHRDTVAREKGRKKLSDEIVTMHAINARIDDLRQREEQAQARAANEKGVIVVRDDG